MEQIRSARLSYWYKGAELMYGALKATPCEITVELELNEEFDDFPAEKAEMKNLKPTFVPPTADQPWSINFD